MSIILGIDPGSRITGYGVIRVQGTRTDYLDSGCIRVKLGDDICLSERLVQIFRGISTVIEQYHPDEVAIERVFMSRNPDSALKLGQARGAAMVAAALAIHPVAEYSPRQIKQAVVGTGGASKEQVQRMLVVLLKLNRCPQADAADALAVALCHSHMRTSLAAIPGATRVRNRRVQ